MIITVIFRGELPAWLPCVELSSGAVHTPARFGDLPAVPFGGAIRTFLGRSPCYKHRPLILINLLLVGYWTVTQVQPARQEPRTRARA